MLGCSVGNYQLVTKLGEGGMGTVYLGEHRTLGKLVAIKVLHAALSTKPEILARFHNEARAAIAIRHPGIVEVYDVGVLDDGSAYIIMEFLDGESLAARLARGIGPVGATLAIVRAIARALQAAHELAIVHRDLKPDNVFLVPDAELASGERVKLLDFGIAKLSPLVGETGHTSVNVVMGTPTYMAPEQCRGAGSVDHRADLYALGCIAYEMLCGEPPFVEDGVGEVIAHHLYFAPTPPRAHRPELAPEIEQLVLELLAKDAKARPSSAIEVVRRIDQLSAVVSSIADERRDASVVALLPMAPPVSSAQTARLRLPATPPVARLPRLARLPSTTTEMLLANAPDRDAPEPELEAAPPTLRQRLLRPHFVIGAVAAAAVMSVAIVGARGLDRGPAVAPAALAIEAVVPPAPPVVKLEPPAPPKPDTISGADEAPPPPQQRTHSHHSAAINPPVPKPWAMPDKHEALPPQREPAKMTTPSFRTPTLPGERVVATSAMFDATVVVLQNGGYSQVQVDVRNLGPNIINRLRVVLKSDLIDLNGTQLPVNGPLLHGGSKRITKTIPHHTGDASVQVTIQVPGLPDTQLKMQDVQFP